MKVISRQEANWLRKARELMKKIREYQLLIFDDPYEKSLPDRKREICKIASELAADYEESKEETHILEDDSSI